jgi:hypothetical protein
VATSLADSTVTRPNSPVSMVFTSSSFPSGRSKSRLTGS